MDINTTSTETVKIIPDELCHTHHPNMVARDDLYADLSKRAKDTVFPYQIVNLSSTENLYLPKNHVVAFVERDKIEGDVFDIEEVLELEMMDTTPRMWVPKQTSRLTAKSAYHHRCKYPQNFHKRVKLHQVTSRSRTTSKS